MKPAGSTFLSVSLHVTGGSPLGGPFRYMYRLEKNILRKKLEYNEI